MASPRVREKGGYVLSSGFHPKLFRERKTMNVTLKCAKCGSDKFDIPSRPNNNSKITCGKCGAVETYGKLVKAVGDKVTKDLQRQLGKLFK
ncbi:MULTISPECIES: ECs_2282 family putative zinc-binding protein [Pseudomonas]|uniref:ECs_2282 family putative zinc-binding protein n=2 Tax=Pseudomonas TaxID=286 RepID=UPI0039A757A1